MKHWIKLLAALAVSVAFASIVAAIALANGTSTRGTTVAIAKSRLGRILVDSKGITLYDFVKLTADALGVGPPRRSPAFLARLIAGSNAVVAATRSARTSNAKLKRELGWKPHYPTAREGVPDAVAKVRAAGAA